MSPAGITSSGLAVWAANGLLAVTIAVIGFSANREIQRDDEQEIRLRAIEQTCVEIRIMRQDITEMKGDMKTILRKP
jgi:hypothetical protein